MRAEAYEVEPELVGTGTGMGTDAGALVAQGMTLMRVENESMLAVAVQRPRSLKKVLASALEELKLAPDEAKRAYYSIPYKEKQPDGSTKLVPVEGPSIKAAMTLARLFGNCSVTSRALNEDATGSDLAGIFIDFETNFRVERPMRASKVMRKRNGGTWTLNPQQWLAALQAAASKASRNAVLNGLPAFLVATYMKNARLVAAGDPDSKADPKKVAGLLRAFDRFKVTKEMLEKYVDEKIEDWMGDHLGTLIGLGNAIADKQLTVEEAFDLEPADAPVSTAPATATSGVNPEAIAGGATTGTDGSVPGAAAPKAEAPAPPPVVLPPVVMSDDDIEREAIQFVEATAEGAPKVDCVHPNLKRPIPKGKSHTCPDCTLDVKG